MPAAAVSDPQGGVVAAGITAEDGGDGKADLPTGRAPGGKREDRACDHEDRLRGGQRSWKAAQAVLKQVQVSQRFSTLRDLVGPEAFICREELTIIKLLGRGAFGDVSLARLALGGGSAERQVAVKQLKPELLEDEKEVSVFLGEVKLLRKLRHRNIVEFVGAGSDTDAPGGLFYVQEVMHGGSMLDLVHRQMMRPFEKLYSNADALRWFTDCAAALAYLHSRSPKVLHRDLKLDNIMLTDAKASQATAKLGDFGLARLVASQSSMRAVNTQLATLITTSTEQWSDNLRQRSRRLDNKQLDKLISAREVNRPQWRHLDPRTHNSAPGASPRSRSFGGVPSTSSGEPSTSDGTGDPSRSGAASADQLTGQVGSYTYMAPEVLQKKGYDDKADVFSLGMVMYCAFSRTIPALQIKMHGEEEDLLLYAWRVANGYRPPLSPGTPKEVCKLIELCWKGSPELRPTAQELLEKLQRLQESGAVPEQATGLKSQGCGCVIC